MIVIDRAKRTVADCLGCSRVLKLVTTDHCRRCHSAIRRHQEAQVKAIRTLLKRAKKELKP